VAQWNLARLAEALLPLIDADQDRAVELAVASLDAFLPRYDESWAAGMRAKLGLADRAGHLAAPSGTSLIADWVSLVQRSRVDHTASYRALAAAARGHAEPVRGLFLDLSELDSWLATWLAHRPDADLMDRTNPLYIPRNHLVEEALAAATDGDLAPFERLLDTVTTPYDQRPGLERYTRPAPDDFGTYRTFCGT
jgi:uncharacterized protein YdiU (UPF0061 family)